MLQLRDMFLKEKIHRGFKQDPCSSTLLLLSVSLRERHMHWWTAIVASTYPMARYLVLFEFRQQKDKSKSKSNLKCTSLENEKPTAECEHAFMCVRPWRAFPSRASSSGLSSAFSFSMWKSSWFCVALFISVCFKRPSITLIWDSFCAACKPWEQLLLELQII